VVGVLASAFVIGWTLQTLDASMRFDGVAHAIGTDRYAAPQATLMATIIKGLLAQDLPWGLVFIGMAIAVVVELCGVGSLSFAVGAYLPLSTTLPSFVGGALKWFVDRRMGVAPEAESEVSSGMLYSTGLVAGGSLTGIAIALLAGIPMTVTGPDGQPAEISILTWLLDKVAAILPFVSTTRASDLIGLVAFGVLGAFLYRAARERLTE